jgi:hypothetical protein
MRKHPHAKASYHTVPLPGGPRHPREPDGYRRLTNMQKIVRAQERQENAESQSQVTRIR